jgi:hypothetical protein
MCGVGIRVKIMYHDGRDWIVELRGQEYWALALDEDQRRRGLPSGMVNEDMRGVF